MKIYPIMNAFAMAMKIAINQSFLTWYKAIIESYINKEIW